MNFDKRFPTNKRKIQHLTQRDKTDNFALFLPSEYLGVREDQVDNMFFFPYFKNVTAMCGWLFYDFRTVKN